MLMWNRGRSTMTTGQGAASALLCDLLLSSTDGRLFLGYALLYSGFRYFIFPFAILI
jgi:hypothetical protein